MLNTDKNVPVMGNKKHSKKHQGQKIFFSIGCTDAIKLLLLPIPKYLAQSFDILLLTRG